MTAVIYVLYGTTKAGATEIFYVGRTANPTYRRQQHLRDCADLLNAKPAYEWARQSYNGKFEFQVFADESDVNTEGFWIKTLRDEGHPLQNADRGNAGPAKKRKTSQLHKEFQAVNKAAMAAAKST